MAYFTPTIAATAVRVLIVFGFIVHGSNAATTVKASPTATAFPTASCTRRAYYLQDDRLYYQNLDTGRLNELSSKVGDGSDVTALGYNTVDNYLYGIQSSNNAILRISGVGTTQQIGTISTNLTYPLMGDVDSQGQYWVSENGQRWAQVDLHPKSSTYAQTVASGTSDQLFYTLGDWVYLPVQGQALWSIGSQMYDGTTTLLRWNMTSHEWTYPSFYAGFAGATCTVWPALYGRNNGNGTIYALSSTNSGIFEFPIGGVPSFAVDADMANIGDNGARCVTNTLG